MLHVTVRRLSEVGAYALIGVVLLTLGAIKREDAQVLLLSHPFLL